jgi:hypothetical protein
MANKTYSLLAILGEINRRELKQRLESFPADLHYYATAAIGIIGTENARRMQETPEGVKENSEEFISKLREIMSLDDAESFREILETCLLETLGDELKFCCLNCKNFEDCLQIESLSVGDLFCRRTKGEETPELRDEISREVDLALRNTPYIASAEADRLCSRFVHQYKAGTVGEVFGRYGDIASALQKQYGLDYRKFLQKMISINMEFIERGKRIS